MKGAMRVWMGLAVILLLLIGLGCSTGPTQKGNVKVGMTNDFTNPGNVKYAKEALWAVQKVINEINATGGLLGRNVELVYADDKTDPTVGVTHARRMKDEGIVALVGGVISTVHLAQQKWSESEGHVPIVGNAVTDALDGKPWSWRTGDNNTAEVAGFLREAQRRGVKKIGILNHNLAWGIDGGNVSEKVIPQLGMSLVGREVIEFNAPDATIQAKKLKDAGAEYVLVFDYAAGIATWAKAINSLGWKVPWVSSQGNVLTAAKMVDPALIEGGITGEWGDLQKPSVKALYDEYERTMAEPATHVILTSYAAMRIVAEATKKAGSADPEKVNQAISSLSGLDLPIGTAQSKLFYSPQHNYLLSKEDLTNRIMKGGKLTSVQ